MLYRLLQETDEVQQTTKYQYSNLSSNQQTPFSSQINRPNQRIEQTFCDSTGAVLQTTHTAQTLEQETQVRNTVNLRDAANRINNITHPDKTKTYTLYDQQDRLGLIVSPSGQVTEHQFDRHHRANTQIQYANCIDTSKLGTKPQGDTVVHLIKPNAQLDEIHYTFKDASGRIRYEVDAENYLQETQYDAFDRKVTQIKYATALTADELTQLQQNQPLKRSPDLSKDCVSSSYYDLEDRLIGTVDPEGWVVAQSYDVAGLLIHKIAYATPNRNSPRSSDFETMRPQASADDAKHYYFYDDAGNVTLTVNPGGWITTADYYPDFKIKTKYRYANPIDAQWYENTTVCPQLPVQNQEDRVTHFLYDNKRRLLDRYDDDGSGQQKTYDSMGSISQKASYDATERTDSSSHSDGDLYRASQTEFDGWEQPQRKANAMVCQLLARIDNDNTLSSQQKSEQKELVWQNQSLRLTYEDSGLLCASTDTLGNRSLYYYDNERRCVLTIDPRGAAVQTEYDSFDRKVSQRHYLTLLAQEQLKTLTGGFLDDSITNLLQPNDEDPIEKWTYNRRGLASQYTDPEEYPTEYHYDAFRNLVEENRCLNDKQPSLTLKTTFNLRQQPTSHSQTADLLTLTTHTSYENLYGKVTQTIDAEKNEYNYQYDPVGNQTTITNPKKITTSTKTFDAFQRVLTDTDANEQTTHNLYNQQQRCKTITPPIEDTAYSNYYNAFGQLIQKKDALNQSQYFSHHPNGQVADFVDENARKTQTNFDTENRRTQQIDPLQIETIWQFNEAGALEQKVEDNTDLKLTTSYGLDALNRRQTITNPRGILSQQTFNSRNLVIKKIQDVGSQDQPGLRVTTLTTYNGQHKRISLQQGDDSSDNGGEPNQYALAFLQDGLNRDLGKIVDPITDEYPAALALTQQCVLNGNDQLIAYTDPNNHTLRTFYDACRNRCFTVGADGNVEGWSYDNKNRNIGHRRYTQRLDPSKLNDSTTLEQLTALLSASADDAVFYSVYDANDRLCFELQLIASTQNESFSAVVRETRYDNASRHQQTIAYSAPFVFQNPDALDYDTLVTAMAQLANSLDRHSYFLRDAVGQLCVQINPRGAVTQFEYDLRGRAICKTAYATLIDPADFLDKPVETLSFPTSIDDRRQFFVFDVFNKPLFTVEGPADDARVIAYQHDAHGNLTLTCHYALTIVAKENDDELVQQLKALVPDEDSGDRIVCKQYDALDRVSKIIDTKGDTDLFSRDALNNLRQHTDRNQHTITMEYDRARRLIAKQSPSTTVTTISQDDSGVLVAESERRVVTTAYQYDKNNNLLVLIHDVGYDQRRIDLSYTALNQLAETQVTAPVDDAKATASRSTLPVELQEITTQKVYNSSGKLLCEQLANGSWQFNVYDNAQRLVYVVHGGNGKVIGYQHNSFHEVVTETHYATALALDFSDYTSAGLTVTLVEENLVTNPDQDRPQTFERDGCGEITAVTKAPVFFYYPTMNAEVHGSAAPVTRFVNNAFCERILITKNRFPNVPSLDTVKRLWGTIRANC